MAIYIKSVLAGAAGAVAALILFVLGVYLLGFIRLIGQLNPRDVLITAHSSVQFSGRWPLALAILAFIAGFSWMIRRRGHSE